jgi:hypothetical protein
MEPEGARHLPADAALRGAWAGRGPAARLPHALRLLEGRGGPVRARLRALLRAADRGPRMSCVYGPRQFGTEDQGWVAHFADPRARGPRGRDLRRRAAGARRAPRLGRGGGLSLGARADRRARGPRLQPRRRPANAVSLRDVLAEIGRITGRPVRSPITTGGRATSPGSWPTPARSRPRPAGAPRRPGARGWAISSGWLARTRIHPPHEPQGSGMTRLLMTIDAAGGVWRYAMDLARGLRAHGVETAFLGFGPRPRARGRGRGACGSGRSTGPTRRSTGWRRMPPRSGGARRSSPTRPRRAGPTSCRSTCRRRRRGCPRACRSSPCTIPACHLVPRRPRHGPARCLVLAGTAHAAGLDRAEAVVAPSVAHGRAVSACYGTPRVRVVPNGVEAGNANSPAALCRRLGALVGRGQGRRHARRRRGARRSGRW